MPTPQENGISKGFGSLWKASPSSITPFRPFYPLNHLFRQMHVIEAINFTDAGGTGDINFGKIPANHVNADKI
jgi:hypothetical protein